MQRDEKFFKEHAAEIPFLDKLNLQSIWTDELSETTKAAIWQYLQTLYILGMTISSLPAETLSMIETVAQKCATEMSEKGGAPDELDESVLMNNMAGLMTSILGPKKISPKE